MYYGVDTYLIASRSERNAVELPAPDVAGND